MSVVLAGFIGRPRRLPDSPEGYQTASYRFASGSVSEECNLFSVALRQYLIGCGRWPRLWLLLGTPGSIWDSLAEVVPVSKRDAHYDRIMLRLQNEVRQEKTSQSLLDEWSHFLSDCLGTDVKCRITGEPGSPDEPDGVFAALNTYIEAQDEIVFDVTHGLRHQPIVASFSVMLLRWIKNVQNIEFLYGAFELRRDTTQPCPVITLPVCDQLAKACEAVATEHYTGSFRQLGACLRNQSQEIADLTMQVAFTDETNQPDYAKARNLERQLHEADLTDLPIEKTLRNRLLTSLEWLLRDHSHAELMLRKAKLAYADERRQLFKAVAYLYEGIVSAACERHFIDYPRTPRRKLNKYGFRNGCLVDLKASLPMTEEGIDIEHIALLRNSIMHGTIATKKDYGATVNAAMRDAKEFDIIFGYGISLLEQIIQGKISIRWHEALLTNENNPRR